MRNNAVVRGVRTLFDAGTATGLSDGQLLERYLRRGDDSAEPAFRALVERHGPMVLRACRGVLHDAHAAEDAFQATFLILARKAAAIRKRDSVASWLFGVARRVAGRAAMQRHRRAAHERRAGELAGARSSSDGRPGDVPEVQEEVDRLPERYRAPVVLCYLEGLTQDEAAIRLNLPASTVRVRLMRARSRLRDRLARRGLTPGALAGLASGRAEALIPTPLVDETVGAAIRFAVGRAAGASGPIAALAEGVIRAMFLARLKTTAALLGVLTCASLWMISTFAGSAPARPAQDPPAAKAAAAAEKPGAGPREMGIDVTVAAVRRGPWERTTTQPGTVQAFDSANLYVKVPGYLKTLKVDIGSRVKKGDLLAELLNPEVDADVEKARAEVVRAEARVQKAEAGLVAAQAALDAERARIQAGDAALEEARSRLEHQQKQLARARDLAARAAISENAVDEREEGVDSARLALSTARSQQAIARAGDAEAKAKVVVAKADLQEARGDVRVAQANLDREMALRSFTRILSPYDGVVTRRNHHVGEYVGASTAGNPDLLFTVVGTGLMRVVVHVPDRDSADVDVDDRAKVWIDVLGPKAAFEGRVARMGYELDIVSHTLPVEIDLPNTDGRLRPGQYGRVEIRLETREGLTIPKSAVISRDQDGAGVCFRAVDGRAVQTKIRLGFGDNRRAEVLEGLKEGDRVIARWTGQLSDDIPVRVLPE